mmetsp:Transcript_15399/g.48096  ORF Transcript_15399/g.48096 Transcript_15399/m.48096 type:complete len:215 (-) Transcript_15399:706-1350(-)
MGSDGGTIVKSTTKTKSEVDALRDRDEERQREREGTLGRCSVSGAPLVPPLVADHAGQVSNKLQTLEALLKGRLPSSHAHVRSAKRDLIDLRVTTAPAPADVTVAVIPTAASVSGGERIVCSLSGTPVDGHHRFEAALPCGCVIATSAWDALPPRAAQQCPVCSASLDARLPLNPPSHLLEPALATLRAEADRRRARKRKRVDSAAPHTAASPS